ncbi:hypothetical protein FRC11_010250 [Ceratobasidium sp. 423]|nr:hypothetical protein FRC11_010250 [Ceratobasidium sp. 423]
MPVMGFVHGHFVAGVIDEILRAPNALQSTVPRGSPGQEQPSDPSSGLIHVLDNKTRGVNSLPRTRDALQSRLQLMLYKRLLGTLLAPSASESSKEGLTNRERLSFPDIWMHHSLDPSACFSPSFLQESSALVFSNGLGPAAENAICLNDLEDVWNTIVDELAHTVGPGNQGGIVSKVLKLVYRRRGMPKKRPAYEVNSQGPSRGSSPETHHDERRHNKKGRAESEDVELQRAIHESLRHNIRSDDLTTQDETSEVVGTERKEESQGLIRETGDLIWAPGGRISPGGGLQRAIDESKKSYYEQVGREALLPSPPLLEFNPKRKRDDKKDIIGIVEFDHDDVLLDAHLSDVLDFWHDRRLPRGVDLEDTGRCRYCEFSEGCEWLEAKAKEKVQEISKQK